MRLYAAIGLTLMLGGCMSGPTDSASKSYSDPSSWTLIERPCKSHLRGLDTDGQSVVWASGTEGRVLKSIDGIHWKVYQVEGAESLDFRDVEAIDSNTAVVMSSGNGVRIYRTSDGGKSWSLCFEDTNAHVFMDGMDFSGSVGLAYGDPIDGRMDLLMTENEGVDWERVPVRYLPIALDGEAGFAASGTGVWLSNHHAKLATGGGAQSRVMLMDLRDTSYLAVATPLASGEATGIFSMAFKSERDGIVVGGNYLDSNKAEANASYTRDGGLTWQPAETTTGGYRSCVAYNTDGHAMAIGRTGSDISLDGGKTWSAHHDEGFFAVCWFKDRWIAVGRNGKMGNTNSAIPQKSDDEG